MELTRRDVLLSAAAIGLAREVRAATPPEGSKVFVVREQNRAKAVEALFEAAGPTDCGDGPVAFKANFNSADPFPASTHPQTLAAILSSLKKRKAPGVTLAERSGMGETRRVLESTGAMEVLRKAGAKVLVLDEANAEQWQPFKAANWPKGFHAARVFTDSGCAIQTMCCKTHRFGGHVTLSLKNTIGLVAKKLPGEGHDYMGDLHGSPHQRAMIAEANLAWRPRLNVMDCLEAFIDGGPESGTRVAPGLFLASDDRCALDAAAIALLRLHGMKGPASKGPIGRTDQLARALELGLGAPPGRIELVPVDPRAKDAAAKLRERLTAG